MKKLQRALLLCVLALSAPAYSGIYTDDLARCLVEKTTAEDKSTLVRWIFVAMAQHPSVASLTKITANDVRQQNKGAGDLFMKLLTESCVDASRKAIKTEGPAAIQKAFEVLGQAAASELFAHPDVNKVMGGLEEFLDSTKLETLSK